MPHRKRLDQPPAPLRAAATRAHDALGASGQLLAMLREYTALEAQHAARLRALAQRMGDCVDRLRPPADNQQDDDNEEEEDATRQSQCVAAVDEVVTFLARGASIHAHLSESLASDLFGEWSDSLAAQKKRVDAQEPERSAAREQLEAAEDAYRHAHVAFQDEFEHACALYADAKDGGGAVEPDAFHRAVQDELDATAATPQPRARSPSKAMQYVGSISKLLLRPSGPHGTAGGSGSQRRRSVTRSHRAIDPREVVESIVRAERQRQACHDAFQAMHRLRVRYTRLCDSHHHEYRCVHSECLASTRASIRKLVIHVSAFTSNLQYDATQLFQQVESLHANDLNPSNHTPPAPELPVAASALVPAPPSNVPLALDHVVRRRFPVVNERPRLLRHQNACHVLAV